MKKPSKRREPAAKTGAPRRQSALGPERKKRRGKAGPPVAPIAADGPLVSRLLGQIKTLPRAGEWRKALRETPRELRRGAALFFEDEAVKQRSTRARLVMAELRLADSRCGVLANIATDDRNSLDLRWASNVLRRQLTAAIAAVETKGIEPVRAFDEVWRQVHALEIARRISRARTPKATDAEVAAFSGCLNVPLEAMTGAREAARADYRDGAAKAARREIARLLACSESTLNPVRVWKPWGALGLIRRDAEALFALLVDDVARATTRLPHPGIAGLPACTACGALVGS